MELKAAPTNGDWLVHQYHGVGQLIGKEKKFIGGDENTYYRIDMEKTTLYIPEDKLTSEWFRPVSTENTIQEMKQALGRPPKKMAQNFNTRKGRIKEVMSENSIMELARIIRDLTGRRKRRNMLSSTEDSALRKLKDRLLSEWMVATGLNETEARKRMKALLAEE
jgi:RNA polymerase-interacting CarD/CdnL/TRCF family regulator